MQRSDEQSPSAAKSKSDSQIVYAVPTYKREKIIQTHALQALRYAGVPEESTYVFCSNKDDLNRYASELRHTSLRLVMKEECRNVVEKFNAIHRYFDPGTKVVVMEDDVESLKFKIEENKLQLFSGLCGMAEQSFLECERVGTKLWGISSNANPFYMKGGRSSGMKFVVANLFGFVSTRDPFLEVSQICKSDYERTLLYFTRYGKIVRNDDVCAITKNYKTAGGMQELSDRAQLEEQSCRALVARFPHLIEINEKKSDISMYMELKIKTQRKGSEHVDLMAMQKIIDRRLGLR